MNCDQVEMWLCLCADATQLPPRIARHLRDCATCESVQQQLLSLEAQMRQFPHCDEALHAKRRFLNQFKRDDIVPAIQTSQINRRHLVRWILVAAAVVVAFVSGTYFRDDHNRARSSVSPASHPTPDESAANTGLFADTRNFRRPIDTALADDAVSSSPWLHDLVDNHIQLSSKESPVDRLRLTTDLSEILWKELVRQAEHGPAPDFRLISQLHNRIVENTIPAQSLLLNRDDHATRQRVVERLNSRSEEAQRLSTVTVPVVADVLKSVENGCSLGGEWVAIGNVPQDTRPNSYATTDSLMASVVDRSLQLLENRDPLRKADLSCAVAEQLSNSIVYASLRGEINRSEKLGICLGKVVDQSIVYNLNRVNLDEESIERRTEYENIRGRCDRATDVLERNLQKAPENARKGLFRALEAKQQHSKTSPRPVNQSPGAKPFVPPGLQKKAK